MNANGQPSTWSNFKTAPNGGAAASTQGSGLASPYLNLFYDDFGSTFIDDFNDGNYEGWVVKSGIWAVEGGELSQSEDSGGGVHKRIVADACSTMLDYTTETRFKLIDGGSVPEAGVVVRYQDESNFIILRVISRNGPWTAELIWMKNGQWQEEVHIPLTTSPSFNVWYTWRVKVEGERVEAWLDGDEYDFGSTPGLIPHGTFGLHTSNAHVHFDDVRAWNDMPELLFFWIDNQPGENTAYYRTEWETRVDSHP